MGTTHNNLGNLYSELDQYDLAMEYHNRSLNIRQKSLPAQHSDFAITYGNIGLVYEKKGELKETLVNLQKAVTIGCCSLSPKHSKMIEIEKSIQRISSKLNYSIIGFIYNDETWAVYLKNKIDFLISSYLMSNRLK
jgi:tetratricopeptide (TPR) repeat protein